MARPMGVRPTYCRRRGVLRKSASVRRVPPFLNVILLLTATVVMGCVDLQKPEDVELCATAGNCSDDPSQHVKRDAKEDVVQSVPDLPPEVAPSDAVDAAPDTPTVDAPTEQKDQAPDTRDLPVMDSAGTDKTDTRDVVAQDLFDAGIDTLRPDRGLDLGVDLPLDLGRDLPPDLRPDLPPDVSKDLPPDLPPPDTAPPGLIAYYPCERATGTSLPDISGNGNNGTLSASGYSFTTGKVGRALSFVAANQGSVTLPPAMFANVTDITIAAWVNVTTSDSWARVIDIGFNANRADNPANGTRYMNLVPKNAGTSLAFSISADGYSTEQVLTAPALPTATWKHVAVVLGTGAALLYVDGNQAASSSTVTLRPRDLGTIDYAYLAKSQFSVDPYFNGMLDEVRIYRRALGAAEVQALFNGS